MNITTKFKLTVKQIYQSTRHFCGAASGKMVLDSIHARTPSQKILYDETKSFPTKDNGINKLKWSSSPDGLTHTLNLHLPPKFRQKFNLYAEFSQDNILRRMIWTMYHFKVPCIVLINSIAHWVVVFGFQTKGGKPKSYTGFKLWDITGFYVRDPWEKVSSKGFIPYDIWTHNFLEAMEGSIWNNKFITISDPDTFGNKKRKGDLRKFVETLRAFQEKTDPSNPSVTIHHRVPAEAKNKGKTKLSPPDFSFTSIPGKRGKIINTVTAKNYALWWLNTGGFYDPKMFNIIMKKPIPESPSLFRNLKEKKFYYYVPLTGGNGNIFANMILSAVDAVFVEILTAMDRKQPLEFAPLKGKKIFSLIKKKYGAFLDLSSFIIEPILVWKPCKQSNSRFLPFHKVNVGGVPLYVRIDGEIFRRLTS